MMNNILQRGRIWTLILDPYYQNYLGNIWIKTITESVSSNVPSTACTPNTAFYIEGQKEIIIYKVVGFWFQCERDLMWVGGKILFLWPHCFLTTIAYLWFCIHGRIFHNWDHTYIEIHQNQGYSNNLETFWRNNLRTETLVQTPFNDSYLSVCVMHTKSKH